ncbi:MAG: VOC family protein [Planctomycetota bacterium]
MSDSLRPFHFAFPVDDLEASRRFYVDVLGCGVGRSSDRWIDFDLFGHQVVAHLVDRSELPPSNVNPVDGDHVPVPHFGVVLEWQRWHDFADHLRERGVAFVLEPRVRFEGQPGEQATMFFRDPAGNALEFKSFRDLGQLFAQQ